MWRNLVELIKNSWKVDFEVHTPDFRSCWYTGHHDWCFPSPVTIAAITFNIGLIFTLEYVNDAAGAADAIMKVHLLRLQVLPLQD